MNSEASSHYLGEAGNRYFAWQSEIGRVGARLNRWKFEPHVSPADVVLDFGCGGGYLLGVLPAARKLGIEPNESARAAAAANGIEAFETLTGVPDGVVDVVISNHALEHTLRPYDELCELRRILKPGGRMVVWLPLEDWRAPDGRAAALSHHLFAWTPTLFRNLLQEAGFHVDRCRVVTHAWSPRFAGLAGRLPEPLFKGLCFAIAVFRRRRQIEAVARKATA